MSYSGQSEGLRFNLGANMYETGGYDFTLTKANGDDDNDAYRNKSVFGSVSNQFSDSLEIGANFLHSEGKSEYDNNSSFPSDTQPYNLFRVTNISSYADLAVNDVWNTRLEAGYAEEHTQAKQENYKTGVTSDSYWSETKRYSTSWKNDIAWHESQLLTAGIDYSDEKYNGSTAYLEDSRYNAGVFVQNHSSFGNQDVRLH